MEAKEILKENHKKIMVELLEKFNEDLGFPTDSSNLLDYVEELLEKGGYNCGCPVDSHCKEGDDYHCGICGKKQPF
jgi:hypothetical protein